MFSLNNDSRMGPEYHSIQGKPMAPCDHPCNNLGEPNTFPIQRSGLPAMNYLGLKDKKDIQQESTGYHYSRKAPGTNWATYDTGDE